MQMFHFISSYVLSSLLFLGSVSIEQTPHSLLNIPWRRLPMTDYQLPVPQVSSAYRTAIERGFSLLKENRYRMENTNTYMGIENVAMHMIEHDIVLTQDIIFDYKTTGKVSPVIKV